MTSFIELQIIDEIISQIVNEGDNNTLIQNDTIEEEEKEFAIITETSMRQIGSKQDYSAVLTIDSEEGWVKKDGDQPINIVAAFDGHSGDLVIDIIRNLDLKEHFMKADPSESIQKAIDEEISKRPKSYKDYNSSSKENFIEWSKKIVTDENIRRSGSTISFAKIYRNEITKKMKIVAEWVGDSPILIFINGELVFISKPHNCFNESEIIRLKEKGVLRRLENATCGFKLIDENKIKLDFGKYICYNNNTFLAMTRSLGHKRITGVETEKHIIECSTQDEVKVLVFSDGVGDVTKIDLDLNKFKEFTAEEIVELAANRWQQEWILVTPHGNEEKTNFGKNGYDDCCCSVWWQIKK